MTLQINRDDRENSGDDTPNNSDLGQQEKKKDFPGGSFLRWLLKPFSLDCLDKIWVPIFTGLGAVLLTTWFNEQANLRQREASQDLNHQAIFESYISKVNDMHLNQELFAGDGIAKNEDFSVDERELIYGVTLPVLRDLTLDGDRKARLILFLYRMDLIDVGVKNFGDPSLINPLNTADLKNANFEGFALSSINFGGADLRGAVFKGAYLDNAYLAYSDLSPSEKGSKLWWLINAFRPQSTQMVPADLTQAYLERANLAEANLSKADFTAADFTDANLEKANLTEATLTQANLDEANLKGVDFTGADLTEAIVTDQQLQTATICRTKLSDGNISDRDCPNSAN